MAALVAVPTMANADDDDRSSGSSSSHDRDRDDRLDAVGLAKNGLQLVRFRADAADDADDARSIGTVRGLVGDTLPGRHRLPRAGREALRRRQLRRDLHAVRPERRRAEGQPAHVALSGTAFGVDFNPAADALRVVSDTGQNLRHPFAGATANQTIADTPLAYAAAATGISAAAYTNNDLDPATATTLFDIDSALDQVAIQAPANAGALSPTGLLGVAADPDAGFDIYSTLHDGRTVDVSGYATLTVGGSSALYEVTILTGEAEKLDRFPVRVTDLAITLDQR